MTVENPTDTWSPLVLTVDGQPSTFRALAHGSVWVALAPMGDCLVTIKAHHVDPGSVALATVNDINPYRKDRPDAG